MIVGYDVCMTTSPDAPSVFDHLVAMPLDPVPAAAIFDCDGTLADTMPLHYEAWMDILDPLGCEFPEALFYAWGGVTAHEIIERLNVRNNMSLPALDTSLTKEAHYQTLLWQVKPIELIVNEARRLHNLGVPLAVASGGLRVIVEDTLATIGATNLFQAIATADDVAHGKPAPDVFLVAAERLRVAPSGCVVFEDAQPGLEAARRAGMKAVNVVDYL